MATGREIDVKVGLPDEIDAIVERLYGKGQDPDASGLDDGEIGEEDTGRLIDLASGAPVIRQVDMMIQRAVDARASDIHIEPFEGQLKVRYRIDGVLQDIPVPVNKRIYAI